MSPDTTKRPRYFLPAALIGLILLNGLLLWLAPAEQTLGKVIKLVYIHGALIGACMLGFVVAGLLGLAWLLARRAGLWRWMLALQRATAMTWVIYLLSSMWVTYAAWGVAIAWGEPRVAATLRVTLAVAVILAVTEIVKSPLLTAAGNALLGVAAIVIIQSAGVIRHPIDPIGASTSAGIQGFYAGIMWSTIAVLGVIAALFHGVARRASGSQEGARRLADN